MRYKTDDEPVTEADRSANQHIVNRIRAIYPDDGILSEESKDDLARLQKERVWIIDPMDGTKEFIARNGEFSVMIGLAVQGRPVLGVVQQPASNLLYAGALGSRRHPLRRRRDHRVAGERLRHLSQHGHGEQPQPSPADRGSHPRTTQHHPRARLRQRGAEGRPHHAPACRCLHPPQPRLQGVGSVRAQALLEAAGGTITDCWGNPLRYNKRDVRAHNGVVASNGVLHDEIIDTVARICEEFGYNQDDGFW